MLFVPDVDLFVNYLTTRSQFDKTDLDLLRQVIFEKKCNKLVYCKEFVDRVDEIIDDTHALYDDCSMLIKMMIDDSEENLSIKVELEEIPDGSTIFDELCNYSIEHKILIGVSDTVETNQYSNSILNISNIQEDNKNFIFSKLLTGEACVLRNTFFTERTSIVELLNEVYGLYTHFENVVIIDRNANVNHTIYDYLIANEPKFKYYKLYGDAKDAIALKRKLKKFDLYSTRDKDLIHERQVIINNIVINMDEDPFNLIERETWVITIQYCENTAKTIVRDKCSLFTKTLFTSD